MRGFTLLLSFFLLVSCAHFPHSSRSPGFDDAAFTRLAEEYVQGYLAWRPQTGTSLGFHQYDGKLTDYSQTSLDAELRRLKSFDRQLERLNVNHLGPQAFYDYRILRSAIQREIFGFDKMQVYSQNP